jgi:16S rRNA (guanine1516-N2)-methyltransferase
MTNSILITTFDSDCKTRAAEIASRLGFPYEFSVDPETADAMDFLLIIDSEKIYLQQTGKKAPGPIYAEFVEGSVDHRRKFGGGKGQMIAKAVGIKSGVYPNILDATAGLGKDAFVLATLGCKVNMLERSLLVHGLLENGLQRAESFAIESDIELHKILQRMQLIHQSSHDYLQTLSPHQYPDVIYLDPMFPERGKSAEVKKEMNAFHSLVGKDEDADQLLVEALAHVNYRVVVKRPRKAPFLNDQKPSFQLEGKSSRFDIYTIKKLPDQLNN